VLLKLDTPDQLQAFQVICFGAQRGSAKQQIEALEF
jgi:hypothetical protein